MYKIVKKDFGFKLIFGGTIEADEMAQWLEESNQILNGPQDKFVVFVDMRTLEPLSEGAQVFMKEGQQLYLRKGMQRSVVILNNQVTTIQFKRIALQTGIYQWERYIDSSSITNWEQVGLDWIMKEIDPDKKQKTVKLL